MRYALIPDEHRPHAVVSALMPYPIIIAEDFVAVFRWDESGGPDVQTHEMIYDWCVEQMGPEGQNWARGGARLIAVRYPDHAFAFKMRWG